MVLLLALQEIGRDLERFGRWYFFDGTKRIIRSCLGQLGQIERTFGVRANLRHFTEPLYRDYTPIAYLFAVPWRLLLVTTGAITAVVVVLVYLVLFLFWLLLPLFISLRLFHDSPF